ncbi:MAG TPA: transporter substrate-binding domain-containing protein [Vicinamibacteria bacterium]|nr:transporter substrate-binding domain-containing protein [Vicinamibacteria bacterium]
MRALALVGAVVLAAPAVADFPDIQARGALRVIVMPLSSADEFFTVPLGAKPGFDREILDGFAKLHRLRLEVVPVEGWDNLIPALLQGRGDVVAGRFTVTDARRRQIAFTTEVFPSRNVAMTRKPHPPVTSLDALKSRRVATIKGSSMAEVVRSVIPAGNLDDSFAPGTLPAALKAGKVEVAVLGVESAIAAQRKDPDIELGVFVGAPMSLAYGVRPKDAALLQALDEYIDNLRRTPTWNRLVIDYFGAAAPEILKKARAQ